MYLIAVKDSSGNVTRHNVPKEVYTYIRQLETYINNPEVSKLKELYPERFNSGRNN